MSAHFCCPADSWPLLWRQSYSVSCCWVPAHRLLFGFFVMAGIDPAIHENTESLQSRQKWLANGADAAWMAGSSPAMTLRFAYFRIAWTSRGSTANAIRALFANSHPARQTPARVEFTHPCLVSSARRESGFFDLWNQPGPVEDRRLVLVRPVEAQHQVEFALGRRQPVRLPVGSRALVLNEDHQ
jgi:hypothetical protein